MSGMLGGGGGPPGYIKRTLFQNYQGAGDSYFNPRHGRMQIDPRFDQMRNQYLGGVQDLQGNVGALSGFGGRFNQLGQEFAGNQGALINARMNPLRGQVARAEGDLQQSIGRRGLGGTSFGTQAMTNFATDTGRALGDAQALATAEAGQFRAGLLGQEMNAEQASIQNDAILTQLLGESSAEFLAQELEAIGLGGKLTAALLGNNVSAEGDASKARENKRSETIKTAGAIFGAISDRRLKKNIKYLTTMDNGINLYSYEYVWGESSVGVMADEVEHIEGAVLEHPSGYKMVDYSRVL